MSMEKQGVVAGEGEAPAKQASDACCADPCKPACGTDPLSKAADAVAEKAACEKEIKDK